MASLGSLISALFNSIKHGTGKETAAIEKKKFVSFNSDYKLEPSRHQAIG